MRTFAFLGAQVAVAMLAHPGAAPAQEPWEDPMPPCDVVPGHHVVEGAVRRLKVAAESPHQSQRENQLREVHAELIRALQAFQQRENPGVWYYFGRYYALRQDPVGADSSFRLALALAPQCEEDIDRYRAGLVTDVLARALEAWQQGASDSSAGEFRLARRLQPKDANIPYYMARMFAEAGRLDSAERYLHVGDSVGAGSPEFERLRRTAMLDVVRAYEARGGDVAAVLQQLAAQRVRRDSLVKSIARDSALLAQLIAEWAGKPLRPEVHQQVQRDSLTLERRLGRARELLPQTREAIARDSARSWQALAPALAAYDRYVDAFPDDQRVLFRLLRVAAAVGAERTLERRITQVAGIGALDLDGLSQAAVDVFNSGQYAHAARLLEVGLAQNPYHRSSLYLLARSHFALGDAEASMAVARRLLAVDPLSPQSVQMVGLAWGLSGQRDSAQTYLRRAQSGMGWAVTVTQFLPTESATVLNGTVQNATQTPQTAGALVFEFLQADGGIAATHEAAVPPLAPGALHALTIRVDRGGVVGWRYRKQ